MLNIYTFSAVSSLINLSCPIVFTSWWKHWHLNLAGYVYPYHRTTGVWRFKYTCNKEFSIYKPTIYQVYRIVFSFLFVTCITCNIQRNIWFDTIIRPLPSSNNSVKVIFLPSSRWTGICLDNLGQATITIHGVIDIKGNESYIMKCLTKLLQMIHRHGQLPKGNFPD